jgi:hypothetical protein
MENVNVQRAVLAGFVATLLMTIFAYAAPIIGLPRLDFAGMLGSAFRPDQAMPVAWTGTWWMGMIIHFVNGTILFALIYAYLLYPILPGPNWARGTQWAVTLWFLSQAIVMPMMNLGFFAANTPQPALFVIASLIAHVIYGATLGAMAREQATHIGRAETARFRRERHA